MNTISIVLERDSRNWVVTLTKENGKPEQYIRLGSAGNAAAKAVQLRQKLKYAHIVGDERAIALIPGNLL